VRRRTGAAAIGAGYAAPPTAGSDLGAGKRGAIHWHIDRGMRGRPERLALPWCCQRVVADLVKELERLYARGKGRVNTGHVSEEREALAGTFDSAADLYLSARPDYPAKLFDRMMVATGLMPGDRVLEIGAGPGKATLPLAQRGLRVTALEPGPTLAARAREALADYPVEVVETSLEDWHGDPGAYDAVVAATSWRWVDPEIRYAAAARALRPDGHLAVWSTEHVFPVGGDPFFAELQEVYVAIGEGQPSTPRPAPGELPDLRMEIEASGIFDMVAVEHFAWTVDYDADSYIRLLRTFSGHIAMAPDDRQHLFGEIRSRLARRADGRLRRGWGAVLNVARRVEQDH
jgi:SAM-dependent methyltransferase